MGRQPVPQSRPLTITGTVAAKTAIIRGQHYPVGIPKWNKIDTGCSDTHPSSLVAIHSPNRP